MCSPDVKRLLIFRCPKLSDGCRVTLLTWLYCLEEKKVLPSLHETANLRGCGRSTVQSHLKEALDAGVITKQNFGTVSVYTYKWDVFAKEMGFACADDATIDKLVGTPAPKNTDADEMALRMMVRQDIKSSADILRFFKAMYREKLGKEYKADASDKNKLRVMSNSFGVSVVLDMIIFFLTHRGRLCLGETSIETLFKNKESLYEKAKGA